MKGLSGVRIMLVMALLFTLSFTVNSSMLFEEVTGFDFQMETKINVQVMAVAVSVEEVSTTVIVGLSTQETGSVIMITVDANLEAGNLLFNDYGWIDIPFYLLE